MTDQGVAIYRAAALGTVGEQVTGLDDIAQSIRVILTTPLGSVPLMPELGWSGFDLMDAPINTICRALVRSAIRALRANEPRIEPTKVTAVPGPDASVALVVTWAPKGGGESVVQMVLASSGRSA